MCVCVCTVFLRFFFFNFKLEERQNAEEPVFLNLQVHAYIISALRKDMPSVFGKDAKKKELIKNLGQIYDQIQREQQISPGDFPDLKKMQECLAHYDFSKFNPLKPKLLETVDKMLAEDIAKLMAMIPHEEVTKVSEPLIKGIIFTVSYTLHTV